MPKKKLTKEEITSKAFKNLNMPAEFQQKYVDILYKQQKAISANKYLNMPAEFQQKYVDILYKQQKAISANKYELGLATNYKNRIHLKNKDPVYRKQFKIPEAYQNVIEQSLEE
jgi:hypothetical protein